MTSIKIKKEDDIFILSNGHAVVALYVVLEQYYGLDAQELLEKYGEHPKRNELDHIHCSTGSLGMGICVAVGRAVGNPNRHVHVMISDGEKVTKDLFGKHFDIFSDANVSEYHCSCECKWMGSI